MTTTTKQSKRRAAKAGLFYVNDFDSGYSRRRCGKGFTYLSSRGDTIKADRTRGRIESLVIPPAWQDVWICSKPTGHIQARGVDDAGRTQYIYHPKWTAISGATKFDRMQKFANLLPRIRRRVRKDIKGRKVTRDRVVACVVRLLDKAQIRIGNQRYTEQRNSRGATTLDSQHVEVDGPVVSLDFPGKSGKRQEIEFSDAKVAKVIQQCEEIDGQFLFCYRDDDDTETTVVSSNVNEYLRDVTNENVSAKDFRTWWGSVTALAELAELDADLPKSKRKRAAVAAVKATATELGNTPTVCRKSYIHPAILAAAESGELPDLVRKADRSQNSNNEWTVDETRFVNILPHLDF